MREQVLDVFKRHLGRLRPSGGTNYLAICPFHKGGQEKTPSFSVNIDKGVYHCFTCHRAGGLKHFLKELGVPRATIDAETRHIETFLQRNVENAKLAKQHAFSRKDPFHAETILPEDLLGAYDFTPEKLVADGFDPRLLNDLEIGYDRNNQRITFPLRDLYGNLAGISGGATLTTQQPKYKVYQGGRYDESRRFIPGDFGQSFDEAFPGYTCENHLYLWNYDRVYPRILAASDGEARVFVVEGFKACLWMMMAGFWNTVALMGSYISDNQRRLLERLGCPIVLFLDNDDAGRNGTMNIGSLMFRPMHGKVEVVPYPHCDVVASIQSPEQKTQPDDYELDAVQTLARSIVPFRQHFTYMKGLISW